MRILGIDPGIATTGFGIIDKLGSKHQILAYGIISTPAKTALSKRLASLSANLKKLIIDYKPDFMAVEELFFNNNAKTALIVGQARGVILLASEDNNIPVFTYTPLQVKMAVSGYGHADKKQVQYMVKHLLNLDKIPKPDDAADALAIAICHGHSYNSSLARIK
ncbi:crossover junction endodeoxyribonuclease RuvC [Thermoproteota archaeon]